MQDRTSGNDRDYINYIKQDLSSRNRLYKKLGILLNTNNDKARNFKNNLEMLHNSLFRAEIEVERLDGILSFENVCLDFSTNPKVYENLIKSPSLTARGKLRKQDIGTVIALNSKYLCSDHNKIFAGLFEIMYQIRNYLIHGYLPEK